MADESSTLRRRAEAIGRRVPAPGPDEAEPRSALVGRVIDGGNMPSTVPAVYLVVPDRIAADRLEGAAPTETPGSGSTPVLVLGPVVPAVGSRLTARLVGGTWVSGSNPQPPCPPGASPAIVVLVREYCRPPFAPGPPIEGAEVVASDPDGVLDDATATTGPDGVAVVELPGPGTWDVTITTPGGCVVVREGVVVRPCERRTLPVVEPCCGTICVEPYDYDTASPVSDAVVDWPIPSPGNPFVPIGNPAFEPIGLDEDGEACWEYSRDRATWRIRAAGYYDATHVACACDCEGEQRYPVAMFSTADFVFQGLGCPPPNFLGFPVPTIPSGCSPEPPCEDAKAARPRDLYRRVIFADVSGPAPLVGPGVSGLALTLAGEACLRWVGWADLGGKATRRVTTTVINSSPPSATITTVDEPYDFPRARVTAWLRAFGSGPPALSWENFVDSAGIVPAAGPAAVNGYVVSDTTAGTVRTIVTHQYIPIPYCPGASYPFAVHNYAALAKPGATLEQLCPAGGPRRWRSGGFAEPGAEFTTVSSDFTCAPVDSAGVFWCGVACGGPYSSPEVATYALYE